MYVLICQLEALLSSKVAEAESITAKACAEEEEWKGKAETLEFKVAISSFAIHTVCNRDSTHNMLKYI